MKYLGLDLGSVTCGIAISDKYGMLASIYNTLRFDEDNYDYAADEIAKIIAKEKIEGVILGYPKHMNGDVGIRGQISEDFKKKLENLTSVEVILWDERLTSMEVNKVMLSNNTSRKDRKAHKDELAAVIILQGYLDFKRR